MPRVSLMIVQDAPWLRIDFDDDIGPPFNSVICQLPRSRFRLKLEIDLDCVRRYWHSKAASDSSHSKVHV